MFDREQSVVEDNSFNCVALTFSSPLIKQFEVNFPTTQQISLTVALTSDNIPPFQDLFVIDGQLYEAQELADINSWVLSLAVNRKINQLRQYQPCTGKFNYFDGFVVSTPHSKAALSFIHKTTNLTAPPPKEKQKVRKELCGLLTDLHMFHIVLGKVDSQTLRLRVQDNQPTIVAGPSAKVLQYPSTHLHWRDRPNPYHQDFEYLQRALRELPISTNLPSAIQLPSAFSLFKSIFTSDYLTLGNINIATAKGQQTPWNNIQQFYELTNQKNSLKSSMTQEMKQSNVQSWENLQRVSNITRELQSLQFQIESKKYKSFNPFQDIKKMQTINFESWLELQPFSLEQGQHMTIQGVLACLSKNNQGQLLVWHFLKAKLEWKQCRFYKALAHLKQARRYMQGEIEGSAILFEEGRNYQHLCSYENALDRYKESLCLRERHYGSQHFLLLLPLYSLLLLSHKLNKLQTVSQARGRIRKIMLQYQRSNIPRESVQLCLIPVLQYLSQLASEGKAEQKKNQKQLEKKDIIKIQSARFPLLQNLITLACSLVQNKTSKLKTDVCELDVQKSCDIYHYSVFVKVLAMILGGGEAAGVDDEQMQQVLNRLKGAKSRNYYRFLYLFSFYWQRKDNLDKSITCINSVINNHSQHYSRSIMHSLRNRYLLLCRKTGLITYIKQFYHQHNMPHTDFTHSELFQCTQDYFMLEQYPKTIKYALLYLKQQSLTNEHPTQQGSQFSAAKTLLIRSYLKMKHFEQARVIIKQSGALSKMFSSEPLAPTLDEKEDKMNRKKKLWTRLLEIEKGRNESMTDIFRAMEQQLQNYFGDLKQNNIVDLISPIAITLGHNSKVLTTLHLIILKVISKTIQNAELMVLLWLANFKIDLCLSESDYLSWDTKKRRDARLDQLLALYFQEQVVLDGNKLTSLWWFAGVRQDVEQLKEMYKTMMGLGKEKNQQIRGDALLSFRIKYNMYFSTDILEGSTLAGVHSLANQLGVQDIFNSDI